MKSRLLSVLTLLTASAFAQQPSPSQPLPPGLRRFQTYKGMTREQVLAANKETTKNPKLLYAEYYFIAPQIVDGLQAGQGVWTTEFHIINLDPINSTTFELDFFNPSGTAASVGIVGTGGAVTSVSSVSGSLDPGQEVTYVTGGLPTTTQVYWGMLNYNSTGQFVSLYESINLFNAASNYLASESGPSDFGIYNYSNDPGTYLPFDNTNSGFTTLAFVNPDAQIDAEVGTGYTAEVPSIQISFINSSGTVFDTETYTVPSGTQTNVIIANTWPKTAGIAGTMYILPYTPASGATAASFPEFSDITILALQSKSTQNGSGFSHTNAFVPLLTIGCYTGEC
jgi:hypothetical protein